MNNKKIIFLSILGFIIFLIIVIILLGASSGSKNQQITSGRLKVWILDDSLEDFNLFLEDFKNDTGIKNISISVESFSNYEEYNKALSSAIIKGEAPDLYMLNNNEKSIFLENAVGIDPNIISPDEMRSYFKPFFGDDLILTSGEGENKTEFMVGVPFGFETLGLYYNFKRVTDLKKLESFPKIEEIISDFDENRPGFTALGVGLGSTVRNSEDIITQFIMSSGVKSIFSLGSSDISSSFSEYFNYASGDNNYIKDHNILSRSSRDNFDYFIDGKIAMIFGYPRMLNDIADSGFSKNFLRATGFPDFINDTDKLVNYNYFVLNKNTINKEIAYEFLAYLFSESGQKAYLKNFKYYLPARISLYSELKETKIHDDFHVKLKNFYNNEAIYSSFDKGIKSIYDKDIINLMDSEASYLENTSSFVSSLKCMSSKIINLENLSNNCG